jgi:hypothetical protein
MLQILQGSEANKFKEIGTRDESWFRYSYPSSKMFAQSPAEVIQRKQQVIGAKETMITLFLTTRKPIVLDVRPKGHNYNQQYFVDYSFPELKKANLSFHRRMPESIVWVHMDNSMCHNESNMMSKFGKHHVSQSPYSPDITHVTFGFLEL